MSGRGNPHMGLAQSAQRRTSRNVEAGLNTTRSFGTNEEFGWLVIDKSPVNPELDSLLR